MCDVIFHSLLVTAKKMIRVIDEPGMERRLGFGKMVINRIMEQVMITGKDVIMKLVEVNNGLDHLTRAFTFMEFGILAMTLIIAKVPDGFDGVKDMGNSRDDAWFC